MLFSPIAWALAAITLLVALPGAFASPSPKRSKKQASTRIRVETYPAIEGEEEIEISVPRTVQVEVPPPPKAAPKAVSTAVARRTIEKTKSPRSTAMLGSDAPTSTPISRRRPIEKFDVVPAEKREQVLKRMQLCQALFVETGRAYDYRTMTTRELESELRSVRQAKVDVNSVAADLEEKDPILNPDLSLEVE